MLKDHSVVLKFTLSWLLLQNPLAYSITLAFDSQHHVIELGLCLWGHVSVMKISGSKSILMTHWLYVFAR